MHTKLEMMYNCLQEAMLITSTTLTMTRMALNQTALGGLVSAVQLVQTTSLLKMSLKWRPSRFFII